MKCPDCKTEMEYNEWIVEDYVCPEWSCMICGTNIHLPEKKCRRKVVKTKT